MYTLNDLKRRLKVGTKIVRTSRFEDGEFVEKEVVRVQTNGVYLKDEKHPSSFLPLERASLITADNKGFVIHQAGERDLTKHEKKLLDDAGNTYSKSEFEQDMMTDTNICYYRKYEFLRRHNVLYLLGGSHKKRGMRYNSSINKVIDESIKGKVILAYKFV